MEERGRRWTERVSKWQASGQSQAAFCREHGLNGNTFNYWKLRVLKQRRGKKLFRPVEEVGKDERLCERKFIPVRVISAPACAYEVSLRSGHTLRIASDFDEAVLRRLIGVLEEASGAC
jgi:hypothetical protein